MTDIKRTRTSRVAPAPMMDARNVGDSDVQRAIQQIQEAIYALQARVDRIALAPAVAEEGAESETAAPQRTPPPVTRSDSDDVWVTATSESALTAKISSMKLVPPRLGLVTDGVDKGLCYVLSYESNGITKAWRCVTIRPHTSFPQIPAGMLPRQIWRNGVLWHAKGGDVRWTLDSWVFNSETGNPGT
jgi:hypothetical protein